MCMHRQNICINTFTSGDQKQTEPNAYSVSTLPQKANYKQTHKHIQCQTQILWLYYSVLKKLVKKIVL